MHFKIFLDGFVGHLIPNNGIYIFNHVNGIKHNTQLIPDRAMTLSMYRSYTVKTRWVISTALPSTQRQSDIHSSLPSIRHYDHRVFNHIPLIFSNIMTTRFRYVFFQLLCNSFWSCTLDLIRQTYRRWPTTFYCYFSTIITLDMTPKNKPYNIIILLL